MRSESTDGSEDRQGPVGGRETKLIRKGPGNLRKENLLWKRASRRGRGKIVGGTEEGKRGKGEDGSVRSKCKR